MPRQSRKAELKQIFSPNLIRATLYDELADTYGDDFILNNKPKRIAKIYELFAYAIKRNHTYKSSVIQDYYDYKAEHDDGLMNLINAEINNENDDINNSTEIDDHRSFYSYINNYIKEDNRVTLTDPENQTYTVRYTLPNPIVFTENTDYIKFTRRAVDLARKVLNANMITDDRVCVMIGSVNSRVLSTGYASIDDIFTILVAKFSSVVYNYETEIDDDGNAIIGHDSFIVNAIYIQFYNSQTIGRIKSLTEQINNRFLIMSNETRGRCLFTTLAYMCYFLQNNNTVITNEGSKDLRYHTRLLRERMERAVAKLKPVDAALYTFDDVTTRMITPWFITTALKTSDYTLHLYNNKLDIMKTIGTGKHILHARIHKRHIEAMFEIDTVSNIEHFKKTAKVIPTESELLALKDRANEIYRSVGQKVIDGTYGIEDFKPYLDLEDFTDQAFKDKPVIARKPNNLRHELSNNYIITYDLETLPYKQSEVDNRYLADLYSTTKIHEVYDLNKAIKAYENTDDVIEMPYLAGVAYIELDSADDDLIASLEFNKTGITTCVVDDKLESYKDDVNIELKIRNNISELNTKVKPVRGLEVPSSESLKERTRTKQFYSGHDMLNTGKCVVDMLKWIASPDSPFADRTVYMYAHNGGKFDTIIILRYLLALEEYALEASNIIELNNRLINVTAVAANNCKLIIRDSFSLMPSSLSGLCKAFNLDESESKIDDFNIMDYRTPEAVKENIEHISEYHKLDVISLLNVLLKFDRVIRVYFPHLTIGMSLTISSLSKLLLYGVKHFFPHSLHSIDESCERFCRIGYRGGRTEAFKLGHVPGPLYYYDFSSFYPAQGSKHIMPGGPSMYIQYATTNNDLVSDAEYYKSNTYPTYIPNNWTGIKVTKTILNNIFKHFPCSMLRVKVKSKTNQDNNFQLLSYLHEHRITFPVFENPTEAVFTLREIMAGIDQYDYELFDGYHWHRSESSSFLKNIFNGLYKIKSRKTNTPVEKYVFKLLVNSVYGSLAFNRLQRDKLIVTENELEHLQLLTSDNSRLMSHVTVDDYNFCIVNAIAESATGNPAVAAHITANARIELWRVLNFIKARNGQVYYVDTDSIITDLKLEDYASELESERILLNASALGSLNNELGESEYYDDGIILGCKAYAFFSAEHGNKVAMKGVNRKDITEELIMSLHEKPTEAHELIRSSLQTTSKRSLRSVDDLFTIRNLPEIKIRPFIKSYHDSYSKGDVDKDTLMITPLKL